ncbi:MAG TPA: FAD-dependent oxidoreductase [Flavipsychrobacter sp.]|nr:FAD-dependent oxidoreductase [Flavipsychrobacter sp.]
MMSYWEQQSFTSYDYVVVGAGIVGLSTGIELQERFPSASVVVLERGLLPTGASSRNAGFACMGSVTELLDDLKTTNEAEVFALFEARKRGLERLRNRLGDATIGYAANGSYELIGEDEINALEKIDYLNKLLLPITQKPAFALSNEKIEEFGFSKTHTKALIKNTCEGELHTGKMLAALTLHALKAGIEIKTGAEVKKFVEEKERVLVEITDSFRENILVLSAKALVLCTNAFTKQLLPHEDVKPGRGQVLITQPVTDLKFKGIFHFDKGYYYFREIDGRILIGGGRNLDFEGETTTSLELNERIQLELERKLHEIIIPGKHFLVAQRWSGIMAFGASKQPVVKAFSDKVFGAFRMGGMGVALGSEVAMQVADMVVLYEE